MAKPDLPTGMPLGLTEPTKTLSSKEYFCFHEVRLKLAPEPTQLLHIWTDVLATAGFFAM